MLTADNILAILPELLLLVLAGAIIALDAIWPEEKRRNLGWLTAVGLFGVIALSILFAVPAEPRLAFGDMVRNNLFTFVFKMLFIFGSAMTALFAMDFEGLSKRGEFYTLMVIATIGMNLMASANDLIMLYIAIETTSIPMYVLAGFLRADHKSTEAGFKYLLFGALTSTIMLYGFSLVFGFTGSTSFDAIRTALYGSGAPVVPMLGALLLALVGFGFKISAVPFHFWAPDVYEGSPTPVAGLLSTASKAAGFAVLVSFLLNIFANNPDFDPAWTAILAALSVVTMTLGNLTSLAQKNIKRLLAYSSIAHAGYILIGVVALNDLAVPSVLFYLGAYMLTNLAAFGAVTVISKVIGSDQIKDYAGLSRRSPLIGLVLLVAFLSLSGMPPLAGFVAKVFVFAAAVKSDWVWLAFVGVLNSIVGLYYYLNVLKVVYLYRAENLEDESKPFHITRPHQIALVALTLAVVLVGIFFGPWFDIAVSAAKTF